MDNEEAEHCFKLAMQMENQLIAKATKHNLDASCVAYHLWTGLTIGLLVSGWTKEQLLEELEDTVRMHLAEERKGMH